MFKRLKIGHKLFLGFGIITLLLLSVVGYSYTNFIRQSQYADVNLHSNNVIRESDALLISLINMETGARGFALTGKEEFLEPFNQGKQDYEKSYNKLLQLTSNDVNQQIRLSNVNNQFQTWLKFETTEIIDARRKVNAGQLKMEDVIAVAQTGKGKEQFDALRSILNSITNEEQELLKVRQDNLARMKSQTTVLLFIGGLISVALASLISFLVIRMILQPITTVTNTFREISEGEADLEIRLKVNSNDELGNMSKYFNTFMGKLKELISENKNQSWLKTGEAELNEKIRGEQGISALSENIINYVSKYLNIQIGALYTRAEEDCFKLSGSYAYSKQDEEDRKIKIGEGVLGQAALEKQIIVINDVPEGYIKVTSALGERKPNSIIAVPLVHNNEIQGIMELGTFHNLESIEMKFINQISIVIAHTLYSAKVRDKMNELLSKTIEQSEELQTQQEELRQNNEELEEQAKALLESEAYLQRQQEELRVANEELQDYAKNLELQKKDIADKNESLKNAQIEIKEKADALELSNKYKSEFLANMSHELRTPLNSILVLSQILMEKKDNSPMSSKELEFAKTIYSSGSDLLKLINDILDLSKVEVGKLDINFEELKIAELANYADRTFSAVAAKKGLYFNFEIQPGLPESIISDGQRVQQIVNNLISNAIKFTSTGGVTIGFHDVKDKNLIEISIADTGIGIPLHKQQIIFEAFTQSDGTTSRKYGGTGLGLSISKELAKLLGGKISLRSEEGKGSIFTLILPYEGSKAHNKEKVYSEDTVTLSTENISSNFVEIGQCKEDISQNNKLLLVVENDPDFSKVLIDLAGKKGYTCLTADTGELGMQLAAEYKPHAILIDIELPDINGWKLVQRLKERKETENIPVHVISERDRYSHIEKLDNTLSYFKNPINVESLNELFAKIESNIQQPVKKILIVDEDKEELKDIIQVLNSEGFQVILSNSGLEAYNLLISKEFDCLILDLKVKDIPAFKLLDKLKEEDIGDLRIIIHTDNQLSEEDELILNKYTQSIIIKGTESTERLISEVSLFLHHMDSKLEKEEINTIRYNLEKQDALDNKKILLVDDDMRNIFSLTSLLEDRGVRVIVGRNGEEAMSRLSENPDTDLILMDIMMPHMDGYTAIQEIKKQGKFYDIPIIAITAKAMKEDRQKCIDAGASDYLTKPLDTDKLISLLRVWLYK